MLSLLHIARVMASEKQLFMNKVMVFGRVVLFAVHFSVRWPGHQHAECVMTAPQFSQKNGG